MENTRKLFISNLKKFRNARGLTQAELAEKIELSLSGYAQIEYGTNWPSDKTLGMLAEKLRVSLSDLFASENEAEKEPTREELIYGILVGLPALDDDELSGILSLVTAATNSRPGGSRSS